MLYLLLHVKISSFQAQVVHHLNDMSFDLLLV